MINLIFGLIAGFFLASLYFNSKIEQEKIYWYTWLIYFSGICSLFFAVDTLFNSFWENEIQAAWMGFGLFGVIGIVLIIAGWRINIWVISNSSYNE